MIPYRKDLQVRVIKLNKARRNIVVSRRVISKRDRNQLWKNPCELDKDRCAKARSKNITDFGAFIDLAGSTGCSIHLMSWAAKTTRPKSSP